MKVVPHGKLSRGELLLPNLYNSALEGIFKEMEWQEFGIRKDGNYLQSLRFANDVVLIYKFREKVKKQPGNY